MNEKKILFAGHNFHFAQHIFDYYKSREDWSVLKDTWAGHYRHDPEQSLELVNKADVLFCEWCLGNAAWYSENKRPGQRLVIRLHHQEMGLPYLDRLKWDAVDALILVCKHHTEALARRYPQQATKLHTIHNVIDAERLDQPKSPESSRTLGFMGFVPKRKSPHVALELLEGLAPNTSWKLRFLGKQPNEYSWMRFRLRERFYYWKLYRVMRLLTGSGRIQFDDYTDDVPGWFRGVGFVLSTSEHESFHMAVAEGMASGAIPLIRDWEGARDIYPEQFIFSTIPEAVKIIDQSRERRDELGEYCKDYARQHFDRSVILPKISRVITPQIAQKSV
jgi:glycosyltransferase involved in cell wall biosynthesis